MAKNYRPTTVVLDEEAITKLDRIVAELGVTRHKFMKSLVLKAIEDAEERGARTEQRSETFNDVFDRIDE